MDTTQQLKKLTTEFQQASDERDCIKEKYEDLLEAYKNLLKECRCNSKGNFKVNILKQDNAEDKNAEMEKKIQSLENKISVLEIQLTTYKEDFQMERKDREAAQDRVIRLEQELTNLCTSGCSHKCSEKLQSPRGFVDSQGFEILPSSLHYHYPPEGEHSNTTSEMKPSCNDKGKGLKTIMSHIFTKKMSQAPADEEHETVKNRDFAPKRDVMYEFDGINKPVAELRGRTFRNISEDGSFLVVPEHTYRDNHRLNSNSFPLDSKRKSDLTTSRTSSVVKLLPQSSSASGSPKSISPPPNDFLPKIQTKESNKGLDSDEILRCPACFRGFKASTEHYKLLQHMDSCDQ